MKDLIAKLHSDAADQILATFATLEMQLRGFAKSSYEKDLRIAELERQLQDHSAQSFSVGETYANALSRIAKLEAQIAAASAPVVEQQPWSHITPRDFVEVATAIMDQHGLMDDLSYEKTEKLCEDMEASFKKLPHPVQADTDKLREEILALKSDAEYADVHQQCSYDSGFEYGLMVAADLVESHMEPK